MSSSSTSSSPPCTQCGRRQKLSPEARYLTCWGCNVIIRIADPRSHPPPPQKHQPYPSPPSPYITQMEDDTLTEAATGAEGSRKCQRVSLEEIKYATKDFDERRVLGHGGEANVYLAQIMLRPSKITQVAVKLLKSNSCGSFGDELRIMPKIQHPNIVSLLGYCDDSGQKILIYEYMAKGNLARYLQKPTAIGTVTSSLSWQQRLKICLGAALGLKHLHTETNESARGIIHRDVKPENILLDENWVAKISDFGMFKPSRADQIDSAMPTTIRGTPGYYAPEYLKYRNITRKIDVYGFGVVLFQVLCRKMPWDRDGETYSREEDEDLGQWARQNVDPNIRGEISENCLNVFTKIIQKSLSMKPEKRPTMDEVALTLQNVLECQERDDYYEREDYYDS